MDKTTIYLIRHGTTAWNQQLRYQGRADNPLDEAGERQGALTWIWVSPVLFSGRKRPWNMRWHRRSTPFL